MPVGGAVLGCRCEEVSTSGQVLSSGERAAWHDADLDRAKPVPCRHKQFVGKFRDLGADDRPLTRI